VCHRPLLYVTSKGWMMMMIHAYLARGRSTFFFVHQAMFDQCVRLNANHLFKRLLFSALVQFSLSPVFGCTEWIHARDHLNKIFEEKKSCRHLSLEEVGYIQEKPSVMKQSVMVVFNHFWKGITILFIKRISSCDKVFRQWKCLRICCSILRRTSSHSRRRCHEL